MGTKQTYMSKLHSFLLLPRTLGVSAADLRGAVSPKPGAADYVSPCKETYVQKVVELGLMPPRYIRLPFPRRNNTRKRPEVALPDMGLYLQTYRLSSVT